MWAGPDGGGIGTTTGLFVLALGAGFWFMSNKKEETGANVGEGPPPSTSTASLPDGWRKMADPASGAAYYLNTATGETQWTVPT